MRPPAYYGEYGEMIITSAEDNCEILPGRDDHDVGCHWESGSESSEVEDCSELHHVVRTQGIIMEGVWGFV